MYANVPNQFGGLPGLNLSAIKLEGYGAEIHKDVGIRQHPPDTAVKYVHDNHKVIITLQKE